MGKPAQHHPERDQRLVDFLRLTGDFVWEADSTLRLTFASRRAIAVIGYHPEDLLGRHLTDFGAFVDPRGNPRQICMKGNFRDACFLATDARGDQRWLSLSTIALFDPDTGAFQGIRGIAQPLIMPTGLTSP